MNEKRNREIQKISALNIIVNLVLAVVKTAIGIVTRYHSFIADGVNNVSDCLNSAIVILGNKLSEKKPDTKHPYGYGRVEYLASASIAIMIMIVSIRTFQEGLHCIFAKEDEALTAMNLVIIGLTVIAKFVMSFVLRKNGERLLSGSLVATGFDALSDGLITLGTIVGAFISMRYHVDIDGEVSIIISCLLMKVGLGLLWEAVQNLIGNKIDISLTQQISKELSDKEMVKAVGNIILNNYGNGVIFGSAEVVISQKYSFSEVSHFIRTTRNEIREKYAVKLSIMPFSSRILSEDEAKLYDYLMEYSEKDEAIYRTVDYFFDSVEDRLYFTVELKASYDIEKEKDRINHELHEKFPALNFGINWRKNISD